MASQGDRRGYTHLLDEFWADAEEQGVRLGTTQSVSAAAFCKARRRLKPELLRQLLYRIGERTEEHGGCGKTKWKGRRVFAIDGTTLTTRRSEELWEAYGSAEGSYYPQVNVSVLYDVLSKLPVDVTVGPYGSCERLALMSLIECLEEGDLLVLDRGYPSYEVIDLLTRRGIDFVIRMPENGRWSIVDEFLARHRRDWEFFLPLLKTIDDEPRPSPRLRLVRCERDETDPVILLTNLSQSQATRPELDDLYHERWAIEEMYKLSKGLYLNQRQMHSMTPIGVEQEILAFFLFIALAQTTRFLAAEESDHDARDLSQKAAILATGRALVSLILATSPNERWCNCLDRVLRRIRRRVDKRRPNRTFQRRSFQPRRRWGPNGRLGKVG